MYTCHVTVAVIASLHVTFSGNANLVAMVAVQKARSVGSVVSIQYASVTDR